MAMVHSPSLRGPDSTLLDRVVARDEAALELLYDRYAPALFAVAFRIAGEQSDAEEIVLDTFTQAWREAARFEPRRGSVMGWLTMICRSRALDLVRGRGRRARLGEAASHAEPDTAPAMGHGTPGSDLGVEQAERRKAVAEAVGSLPSPQREAIELAYFEGLSQSEIAERLGEPLGTIKTRVRLAMQKLRDLLRPYYAEITS